MLMTPKAAPFQQVSGKRNENITLSKMFSPSNNFLGPSNNFSEEDTVANSITVGHSGYIFGNQQTNTHMGSGVLN